jgi:hypothetical protein
MKSNKADFILHPLDDRVNERWVVIDAFGSLFWVIELALKEDDLQEVKQVHLHRMILVVNHLLKGSENGVNYYMSYLVRNVWVTF